MRFDRERMSTLVASAALLSSAIYLVWRVTTTLDGADPLASVTLVTAEVLGLLVFGARVRSSRHAPLRPVEVPEAPRPEVAAVVDATGAGREELRTTLLAAGRVQGLGPVSVVDRGASDMVRDVAARLGAAVHDADSGVEAAVERSTAAWVLLLTAGDLPTPDLVVMATSACCAPQAGIIQLGLEEADPTTFETDHDGRWSLEPFEQQVVRPSLAAQGSIPWYGDGPALIRRGALQQAGGWPEGASAWAIGLAIARQGFSVTHLPLTLARVRAPSGFGDGLARRGRHHGPALRSLVDGSLRGLPRPVRIAHLLGAVPFVGALQRMLLVAVAVMVLGFGQMPLDAAGVALLALAVPAYGLRWATHLLLGRGLLGRLSMLRADLRTLGLDLTPFVRWSPAGARRMGAATLVAIVVALDVVVVVSALSVWREWDSRLPGETAAVALFLTAVVVGVAMEVLLDALVHRQRRRNRRVRLGLVTCRVGDHEGQLTDLSAGGVGVALWCAPDDAPPEGTRATVQFRIPDADGAWRAVSVDVGVVRRSPEPAPGTGTLLGLEFDDPGAAPLDPVIEFLTIDRRLVAMGRRGSFV